MIMTLVLGLIGMDRYYAGWTDKLPGEQWPEENGIYKIVQYEPVGVCAGIGAWNGSGMFFGYKGARSYTKGLRSHRSLCCSWGS
jgi:acyl-CoA reductase-like NAD-dependent aldehyde dehydrogenase